VRGAVAPATRNPGFAARHSGLYEEATFLVLAALASGSGATAGGFLVPREFTTAVVRVPTAEWARVVMRTRDAGVAPHALRASAARQLRSLWRRGEPSRRSSWRLACTAYAGTGARSRGGSCAPGRSTARQGGKGA